MEGEVMVAASSYFVGLCWLRYGLMADATFCWGLCVFYFWLLLVNKFSYCFSCLFMFLFCILVFGCIFFFSTLSSILISASSCLYLFFSKVILVGEVIDSAGGLLFGFLSSISVLDLLVILLLFLINFSRFDTLRFVAGFSEFMMSLIFSVALTMESAVVAVI